MGVSVANWFLERETELQMLKLEECLMLTWEAKLMAIKLYVYKRQRQSSSNPMIPCKGIRSSFVFPAVAVASFVCLRRLPLSFPPSSLLVAVQHDDHAAYPLLLSFLFCTDALIERWVIRGNHWVNTPLTLVPSFVDAGLFYLV